MCLIKCSCRLCSPYSHLLIVKANMLLRSCRFLTFLGILPMLSIVKYSFHQNAIVRMSCVPSLGCDYTAIKLWMDPLWSHTWEVKFPWFNSLQPTTQKSAKETEDIGTQPCLQLLSCLKPLLATPGAWVSSFLPSWYPSTRIARWPKRGKSEELAWRLTFSVTLVFCLLR